MRSVQRIYNEEQLRLRESLETAVRRVGGWCEMAGSLGVEWSGVEVRVRQLEAVTGQRLVKAQQTKKI
jgi:hypothetical protein